MSEERREQELRSSASLHREREQRRRQVHLCLTLLFLIGWAGMVYLLLRKTEVINDEVAGRRRSENKVAPNFYMGIDNEQAREYNKTWQTNRHPANDRQ